MARVIYVSGASSLQVSNLVLSGASGCYGTAVSDVDELSCSALGSSGGFGGPTDVWLDGVTIEAAGGSALASTLAVSPGSQWTLTDTRVAGDGGGGGDGLVAWGDATIDLVDSSVTGFANGALLNGAQLTCTGAPSNDAGVWGNGVGVLLLPFLPANVATLDAKSCDFDGASDNGSDVQVFDAVGGSATYPKGDDETFVCDVATGCP